MKVIFAGTPEFAVPSLHAILHAGYQIPAVITAPDKPAGRGLKLHSSPVKEAALQFKIPVLQPAVLKDEQFLQEIKRINPDVMVVVAFRMMPQSLWSIPAKGTFNLHASLLPQYRGAAPIHWAIINGETETGLTTFFINEVIDAGAIILQQKMRIGVEETAGELHDRMKTEGAELVVKTLQLIKDGMAKTTLQAPAGKLKTAPKLFKHHCRIDWNQPAQNVFNLIRGLSPYPAAYFEIKNKRDQTLPVKVFRSGIISSAPSLPGTIATDGKNFVHISCADAWLSLEEIQPQGKNPMDIKAWLNGFRSADEWEAA